MTHFLLLLLLVLLVAGAHSKSGLSTVRIYSNLAEIIQPLDKLPLEFSHDDWQNIRRDSITLLGVNVNVTSQTITEKKKCLDGTQIYIRWPSLSSIKDTIKLIKGILVDETKNLVKFQDESIAGEQFLYCTVSYDQILYLEKPPESKFYVNFTYNSSDSLVHVSYLRSNLNWRTRYQLNLYNDESVLIAMADIRNDGKSAISIDQAELIGGDINLRMQTPPHYEVQAQSLAHTSSFRASSAGAMMFDAEASPPSVGQGEELAGLYVFAINKPFTIESKTNYLLPMFRPRVTVERYGLISKIFSTLSTSGKAQRSYRLKSDRYLSRGNCIIRELDRLVGETFLPDLAAKDKYEFSIGQDADIVYKENVTLITSIPYNETESLIKIGSSDKIIIHTRTRSIYDVHIEVKNFKKRPINVEYEQKGFYGYRHVKLTKSNQSQFIQDGSSIKSNMTLKATDEQIYSYNIELIS